MDQASGFRRRVEDDLSWAIFAGISLSAARVLWKTSDVGRALAAEFPYELRSLEEEQMIGSAIQLSIPSLLLAGFGIESLLKAIRIRQLVRDEIPATIADKNGRFRLSRTLKTHELVTLADEAEIPLDPAERKLLRRLTEFVTWAG